MGSSKNIPSKENAPKDASPREHETLDSQSSTGNHSKQEKEVTQSASGVSPDHSDETPPKPKRERCPECRRWFRNVGVPVIVTIIFTLAQIHVSNTQSDTAIRVSNTQADTAERLENLRYVRDRSKPTMDLSPHCGGTGGFILTPESTTTNSSTDKTDNEDYFTPELPFKDFDLKGQNLSGLWLNCANFSGANLEGADLSNTYLIRAKLNGANLRNANLQHSQLKLAQLQNADLRGADLSSANLLGTPTDLSILETATLHETILPEDNLLLTPQQKQRLQDLGAIFRKEEDAES
ncbi:pentapeptide repeat-containing protein [Corynebacterium yonathiae]|uniref:pentapeptide repeat-containing protein n=1 Tax=Corynebacterium yonathiae TaxID=2913504 RepID=UPI001EEBAC6B|nr:pentapeptide repeat-containing protein [Corynebacterium sp. BWA136]MDK2584206.1 pentapeptide repeat-containing protein [Corynebacterium sp. BWA136]